MPKIVVLKGDKVEKEIKLPEDRFVFIFDKGICYHMDLSDGDMWVANPQLIGLSKKHKEVVRKNINA